MKGTLAPRVARFPTLGELRREMEGLFDRAWGEGRELEWASDFTPRINMAETEQEYEITAELPGLKPEEINVELKDDVLTISGERKEESEEKGKTFHRVEHRYGTFRRMMTLPEAADADQVSATCKDGVLKVVVPKAKPTRPTKINVNA